MKKLSLVIAVFILFITGQSFAQTKQKNMEDNKDYSVEIIRYNIPASNYAAFEKAYLDAGKLLEASPYCKGYQIIKGSDEPDHYIVTIYWTSEEDHLQKFRKSEQFTGFFQLVKPFYSNIAEMKHYHPPLVNWKR
ncbi:antibiotic biosynthesis monooxygenase family protein [Chitinophaga filiformis]|nr:antibiotic biosynthesis monooxygenase family protein [Chitinophaga filiformis]